jgi:hypothetical protein
MKLSVHTSVDRGRSSRNVQGTVEMSGAYVAYTLIIQRYVVCKYYYITAWFPLLITNYVAFSPQANYTD